MLKKNKKFVWASVLVLVVVIIAGFFVIGGNGVEGNTALVVRGDIEQQVSVTGTLKPVDEVDLSFNRSGKVAEVAVPVGAMVEAGQTLLKLDSRDALIALEEAKVAYEDLINVDLLDVTKAKNNVVELEADVVSSYDNARSTLSAESKSLNDVVNSLDDLFAHDAYLSSNSYGMGSVAKDRRDQAEDSFYEAQRAVRDFMKVYQVNFTSNDNKVIEESIDRLYQVANTVSRAAKESKDIITYLKERDYGDVDEAADAYDSVSSLSVSANDAVDNVFTAKNLIVNNKRLLSEAKLDLADLLDGPDATDIRSSKLAIQQKEKDYSDYFLTSPIAGVVTKQDVAVGEQVSADVAVVSVISADKLEIEANVPEVDIGRVAVGHNVDINFDAFPGENFTGKVIAVDPAQTVIDGVVNFKVTISLDIKNGVDLKSGLTANVSIKSTLAQGVLLVPRSALIERDGRYFVNVVTGRTVTEKEITVGVLGQIGNAEILSGLNEGETILIGE